MKLTAVVIGVMALIAADSPALAAQTSILVELHGGGGFTSVDVQEASGQSGTVLNEDLGMYQYYGRVFFLSVGGAQVGAELGYQYLYYYEAPFGTQRVYRDIDAMRYGAVARLPVSPRFVVEGGASLYSFDGGSVFGLMGALGYDFSLTPAVSVPLRVRADVVLDDVMTVPFGVTLGIAYRL